MKSDALAVDPAFGLEMAAGVARNAEAADAGLRDRLGGAFARRRCLAHALAAAGTGVILSAICAMKVPRPTRTAAKIMMLRMTPHSLTEPPISPRPAAKPRLTAAAEAAILAKRMSEALTGTLASPARAARR